MALRWKIRLLASATALAAAAGCHKSACPEPSAPDLAVPSEYEHYTSVAVPAESAGVQPMTGIAFWTDSEHVRTDCIQLEYAYMRYNEVCSRKDQYDWSAVDRLLDDVASRKHQAILRFYYVYVGEETTVPDYIKALPGYEETVGKSEGERTCFPDWRNTELQRFHLDFYRRFAARYDHDPRLAFLEAGFGLWAEYHIYDGPYIPGRTFPSAAFQAEWLRLMDESFTDAPWCISIDAAEYGPFTDSPGLFSCRFGNFDDSFMCREHDRYNAVNWRYFGEDRYKTAPSGGEFSYYTLRDQKHCLDKNGLYGRTFEKEAARYHLSFIIGNDQPEYQSLERIREASRATGYRFKIRQLRIREGVGAAILMENTGVAPIYRDAFVAVEGVRGGFNLRELMPGQQVWIGIDAPSVRLSSSPAIVCDHLVSGQKINY